MSEQLSISTGFEANTLIMACQHTFKGVPSEFVNPRLISLSANRQGEHGDGSVKFCVDLGVKLQIKWKAYLSSLWLVTSDRCADWRQVWWKMS